jgi:hypothetical protein
MDAPISFHSVPRVVAPRRMKLVTRRSALIAQFRAVLSLLLVWILVGQTVAPNLWRVQSKSTVTSSSADSWGTRSEKSSWLAQLVRAVIPAGFYEQPITAPPVDTLTDAVISRGHPDIRTVRSNSMTTSKVRLGVELREESCLLAKHTHPEICRDLVARIPATTAIVAETQGRTTGNPRHDPRA